MFVQKIEIFPNHDIILSSTLAETRQIINIMLKNILFNFKISIAKILNIIFKLNLRND